jgi:hypothetical protein
MDAASSTDALAPGELAQVLLEIAPGGMMLLRPVYAAEDDTIIDMVFEYLNPVAQRKILLPARPTESLRTLYPGDEGLFAFYHNVYLTGERAEYESTREVAGLTFTYYLVAQRQGDYRPPNRGRSRGAARQPGPRAGRPAAGRAPARRHKPVF